MYCIERGSYLDLCNSFKQTLAPVVLIYCGIKNRRVVIASNKWQYTPPMEKKISNGSAIVRSSLWVGTDLRDRNSSGLSWCTSYMLLLLLCQQFSLASSLQD